MEVKYGRHTIRYTVQEKQELKSHYITVDKDSGVVLKGKAISEEDANKMVLKKASWILQKLKLVEKLSVSNITTGSRLPYLGRTYYVELVYNPDVKDVEVEFNYSRFRIKLPSRELLYDTREINLAVERFYQQKVKEKILPRIQKLSKSTGLEYNKIIFRKLDKRWGSCTASNNIVINIDAVKLPWSLIDYLLIHELCHIKIKNHTKEFWAEVAKYLPNWQELDEKMEGMRL